MTRRPIPAQWRRVPALTPEETRRAVCRRADPELFFEINGRGTWQSDMARVERAKEICGACDIRTRCLEVALARDERFGVFGGLTAGERERLMRKAAS